MESISTTIEAGRTETLRVLHIVSGDRWAGAEVQAYTLMAQLHQHTALHAIIMNEGELSRRCREAGIAITVLDENTMNSVKLIYTVAKRLQDFQPDIVHTHRQKENIFGSIANLLTRRAKCVRTVHGAPEFNPTYKQKVQICLDNLCGRYLQNAIIAVSDDLQSKLLGAFPHRKLRVINNGIDPDEVRADITTPDFKRYSPEPIHIGLVGRLDPVKRVDIFLRMAATLRRESPDASWAFHVFGEGKLDAELKALAKELALDQVVHFHGHRSDIRSCIAALDVMVMPSDHEGLPMAALEALSLGVPLLAHDTGGLSDLLKDRPDCLVKDHSPEGYAKAIEPLLQAASSIALHEDYTASRNSEQILSLYKEL